MKTPQWDRDQVSFLLVLAMILGLMLPIRSFGDSDPPPPQCEETWETNCTTPGSLNTLGGLTKTNEIICVSNSVSCAITGVTYRAGQALQTHTFTDCSQETTPITVNYSASNWWENANGQSLTFPVALNECGTYTFTAKTKGIPSDPSCKAIGPFVVGTFTANAVEIGIDAAGNYIVPGSPSNAIRYAWCPVEAPPLSVRMEIRDRFNVLRRTLGNLPTSIPQGAQWAEQLWDGMESETVPLTEAGSPYSLKLIGTWEGAECDDTFEAKVEEWWLDLGIEDASGDTETLVTGVDERTVTTNNLPVKISLLGSGEALKYFSVTSNVEVTNGPAGNERACYVTPVHLFYTTPATPYDIRYRVVIEQQTTTTNVAPDGLRLDTVMDGTLNPWDMDAGQGGRQTRAIWEFGITSLENTNAVRRGLTETYQP